MKTNLSSKKKFVLIGLGTAAVGILGYFGWQYFQEHKNASKTSSDGDIPNFDTTAVKAQLPSYTTPPASSTAIKKDSDFPLKSGSKGAHVKALQEALIAKYGKSILPKYGADGDFGSETIAALKKAGLPDVINEATYNVLAKGSAASDPSNLALALFNAANSGNFSAAMSSLKLIKSVDEYSAVSDIFKTYRIGLVRKTLVNGVLDSFSNESQKQQIRLEFSRMGLHYDGKQWSLSGLDGFTLITNTNATIWLNASSSVSVPENTVLGIEVERRSDGFSVFENGGRLFIVKSNLVSYL